MHTETYFAYKEKFFAETARFISSTPLWILRIERVLPNLYGIDAIAHVRYPFRFNTVRIPITLAPSKEAQEIYLERHAWARDARVACLIISPLDKGEHIWYKLYYPLNELRDAKFDPKPYVEKLHKRATKVRCRSIRQCKSGYSEASQAGYYRRPPLPLSERVRQWYV